MLLILDAAYAEYVRRNDYASGLELVATSENVVMTRTFSKIHGLANLRLGWLYAPAAMSSTCWNRIRGPFNVNGRRDCGRHRGDRKIEAHVGKRHCAQRRTGWRWMTADLEGARPWRHTFGREFRR